MRGRLNWHIQSGILSVVMMVLGLSTVEAAAVKQEVLVDNAEVRVTRITIPPHTTWTPDTPRLKRVIVSISGNHVKRHAKQIEGDAPLPDDHGEEIVRKAGDSVYRTASKHSIENLTDHAHVSVVVELKRF